jgi:diacylglycerol kinase family enzyme
MTLPTVQIFRTPVAGFRKRRRADALCRALEAEGLRAILTPTGFHRLVIDDRADHVCAFGGDGTLRHVIDAVRALDRAVSVSVYPAGTVNLTAMESGYPRAVQAFASRLRVAEPRPRYLATIGDIPLLACASVGPDSRAVAAVTPRMKRWLGRFAYVVAFLGVLARWTRPRLVLHHDGARTACEAVYVAKGPFFAGPWHIARDAAGGDPRLHVVALPQASRADYLAFVWAIFRGRAHALAGVHRFTCRDLVIEGDATVPLQGDGDILAQLPATIRMEAGAIPFA